MKLDYTPLHGVTAAHPRAIYYKNSLRQVQNALGGTSEFDKSWNTFAEVNALQNNYDFLKKYWHLPSSIQRLKGAKKISKPRTSLLLQISPNMVFGIFRYGKQPLLSGGNKQGLTFHQVSILQITTTNANQLLIDDPRNHAARYVNKDWQQHASSYKGRKIYAPNSSATAQALVDLLESQDKALDIECNGKTTWLMLGGDARNEEQLDSLIAVGEQVTTLLASSQSEVTLPVGEQEYKQLPYGKTGLGFKFSDKINIIFPIIILSAIIFMAYHAYRSQ